MDERDVPVSTVPFGPYEFLCKMCKLEYTYHHLGTEGRSSGYCSDRCEELYYEKYLPERDLEADRRRSVPPPDQWVRYKSWYEDP